MVLKEKRLRGIVSPSMEAFDCTAACYSAGAARPRGLMMALEPRYLYDASALVAGLDMVGDAQADMAGDPVYDISADTLFSKNGMADMANNLAAPADESPSVIIFVDSRVDDYQALIGETGSGTLVVELDANSDGVLEITRILAGYDHIETVHLISHGSSGEITLGSTELSSETIDDYTLELCSWAQSLSSGADILIYGCNVSSGTAGQAFVAELADLTGADVAASDDLTGARSTGGDWELETRIGIIESGLAGTAASRHAYAGTLADYTVDNATDEQDGNYSAGDLSLREALNLANGNTQADSITFSSSLSTITLNQAYGQLQVAATHGVTINGDTDADGDADITISGNNQIGILRIANNAPATLYALNLVNGYNTAYHGGAIMNYGALAIRNSSLSNNRTSFSGGAIFNEGGKLYVYNSDIFYNQALGKDDPAYANGSGEYYGNGGGILNRNGGYVKIDNSRISNNDAYGYTQANRGDGGGISNYGSGSTLIIQNSSTISGNTANDDGGGITNWDGATLKMYNSTISGNIAYGNVGGGIEICESYGLISRSTISNNSNAGGAGGGIENYKGTLNITGSTISGNSALNGGGLYCINTTGTGVVTGNFSTTITNSTISGNTATGRGGAIFNYTYNTPNSNTITLSNSTLSGNAAGTGTGHEIYNYQAAGTARITLYHSTIYNTAATGSALYNNSGTVTAGHSIISASVSGSLTSNGYNLFTDAGVIRTGSDIYSSDAGLEALADNGGVTWTHALKSTSPALNAGDASLSAGVDGSTTDQRGDSRVSGTIDIGALEHQTPAAANDAGSTNENTVLTVAAAGGVLTNDTGEGLTVTGYDAVSANGATITMNADGSFSYDPTSAAAIQALAAGGTLNDTFTYTVTDNLGMTSTAVVTITVFGANDPPTLSAAAENPTYTQTGGAVSLFSGTAVSTIESGQTITGLTFKVGNVSNGANEVITIDGTRISLSTGSGTTGSGMAYTVTVSGGTATVTLSGAAMTPAGAQTLVNGMTYHNTSAAPTAGNRTVTLTSIMDSGGTANGGRNTTVLNIVSSVTVASTNQGPNAGADRYSTDENTVVTTGNVLVNDTDPDTDPLVITGIDSTGTKGIVTDNGDGTFGYDPNGKFDYLAQGESAMDTFTYTISDGKGGTATATVTITITGAGNSPGNNSQNNNNSLGPDIVPPGHPSSNDIPGTGTPFFPGGPSAWGNRSGSGNHDPGYTWAGSGSGKPKSTADDNIGWNNEPPKPDDDHFKTNEEQVLVISGDDLLINDKDENGDTLVITHHESVSRQGATITVNEEGEFVYDPTTSKEIQTLGPGMTIQDTFTYTVSDGKGGEATATVTVTVHGQKEGTGHLKSPGDQYPAPPAQDSDNPEKPGPEVRNAPRPIGFSGQLRHAAGQAELARADLVARLCA